MSEVNDILKLISEKIRTCKNGFFQCTGAYNTEGCRINIKEGDEYLEQIFKTPHGKISFQYCASCMNHFHNEEDLDKLRPCKRYKKSKSFTEQELKQMKSDLEQAMTLLTKPSFRKSDREKTCEILSNLMDVLSPPV